MGAVSNTRSNELRVGVNSNPKSVVRAILAILRRHKCVEISAIGSRALAVALNAIHAASSFSIAKSGMYLVFAVRVDQSAKTKSGAKPIVLTCSNLPPFFRNRVLWRVGLREGVEEVARKMVEELGESQSVAIRVGSDDVSKALAAISSVRAKVSAIARVDMVFPDGSLEIHCHFDNRG